MSRALSHTHTHTHTHTAEILQYFRHFTYATTHSPTLPSLYLCHSSLSNPSVASPTSQFISNPSFASPASQALQLIHLASRPCTDLMCLSCGIHSVYVSNSGEIVILLFLTLSTSFVNGADFSLLERLILKMKDFWR